MNKNMHRNLLVSLVIASSLLFSGTAFSALFFSQDGNSNGLYEVDINTGVATLVGASGVSGSTAGLAPSADEALLYGSEPFGLNHVQADGSGAVFIGGATMEGAAYCSGNDTLYGAINGSFFTVNYTTGAQIASLAAPGFDVEGIACDTDTNTVYGIGDGTDLVAYNIGTDSWSTVGSIGVNLDSGGLAFDPSGVLYAIGAGTAGALIMIDPATAAVTTIGSLGTNAAGGLAWVGAGSTPVEFVPVPTLSTWALILLASLMGLVAFSRRRV